MNKTKIPNFEHTVLQCFYVRICCQLKGWNSFPLKIGQLNLVPPCLPPLPSWFPFFLLGTGHAFLNHSHPGRREAEEMFGAPQKTRMTMVEG